MLTYVTICAVLYLVIQSYTTFCNPWTVANQGFVNGDSLGKNTKMGGHALLQGIFPIQGSNPGLLHCRQILCHLGHREAYAPYIGAPKAETLLC